jgi:hypothetical protein
VALVPWRNFFYMLTRVKKVLGAGLNAKSIFLLDKLNKQIQFNGKSALRNRLQLIKFAISTLKSIFRVLTEISISHKYVQKWKLNSKIEFFVGNWPRKVFFKSLTLLSTEMRLLIVSYDINMQHVTCCFYYNSCARFMCDQMRLLQNDKNTIKTFIIFLCLIFSYQKNLNNIRQFFRTSRKSVFSVLRMTWR